MALPIPANVTVAICRAGSSMPTLEDVAGHLKADFVRGLSMVPTPAAGPPVTWTHVLLLNPDIDVRDAYVGCRGCTTQDTVLVPNAAGTPYLVIFVERAEIGTPHEHKRVYLDRQAPPWPTHHL